MGVFRRPPRTPSNTTAVHVMGGSEGSKSNATEVEYRSADRMCDGGGSATVVC